MTSIEYPIERERISAGKTLVRYDIKPVYREVEITGEDGNAMIDTVIDHYEYSVIYEYNFCYCLLSEADYIIWNERIGKELMNLPEQDTLRYAPEQPQTVNGLCVLPINAEVQILANEKGVTLPEMVESLPEITTEG
jgi:hypothetical protein